MEETLGGAAEGTCNTRLGSTSASAEGTCNTRLGSTSASPRRTERAAAISCADAGSSKPEVSTMPDVRGNIVGRGAVATALVEESRIRGLLDVPPKDIRRPEGPALAGSILGGKRQIPVVQPVLPLFHNGVVLVCTLPYLLPHCPELGLQWLNIASANWFIHSVGFIAFLPCCLLTSLCQLLCEAGRPRISSTFCSKSSSQLRRGI